MDKFIGTSLILGSMAVAFASIAGCGNMAIIDPGNYSFKHLHSDTYHNPMCFTIEKWWDNSTGIEVRTKECGTLYFSEGDYILIEDAENCPYCNVEE
jgi:hypothetical protein